MRRKGPPHPSSPGTLSTRPADVQPRLIRVLTNLTVAKARPRRALSHAYPPIYAAYTSFGRLLFTHDAVARESRSDGRVGVLLPDARPSAV